MLYERDNLDKVFGLRADSFSFEKFRYMCIMAGCDYLANLPGIGLAKAKTFWLKVTNPDLRKVLKKIPTYLNMPKTVVTEEYIERFIKANNTFLYQLVFDPVTRKERQVKNLKFLNFLTDLTFQAPQPLSCLPVRFPQHPGLLWVLLSPLHRPAACTGELGY